MDCGFVRTGIAALAMILAAVIAVPATAQVAQLELDAILHEMTPASVALRRSMCATGRAPKSAADKRAAGIEWPNASEWCVTVMTRQGRDGALGYVRDPRIAKPTPAISFDSGFVGGYFKHELLPAGAPSMATLLPIAEHCLEQTEANQGLCSSVGYMLGLRAALGELIVLR